MDKIRCPNCNKLNDIHKHCIYCGSQLAADDQIKLLLENPEATCLNCGRPVKKGQTECKCGYYFADIKCPECNTKNSYTNRFCISCGKKLWTAVVNDYKYTERLFENHLINETLPFELRNTSLYQRPKYSIGKNPLNNIATTSDMNQQGIKSEVLKIDRYLCEIRSRWKIVSPNYCINCLNIIPNDKYICPKCGSGFSDDEKRFENIQSEDNYIMPNFDDEKLKWTSKSKNELYLRSLAPSFGESQFEYRERLKWEFAENNYLKKYMEKISHNLHNHTKKPSNYNQVKRQPQPAEKSKGGYCSLNCIHCYEEFLDSDGGIVGDFDSAGYVEYYCQLGHPLVQ